MKNISIKFSLLLFAGVPSISAPAKARNTVTTDVTFTAIVPPVKAVINKTVVKMAHKHGRQAQQTFWEISIAGMAGGLRFC